MTVKEVVSVLKSAKKIMFCWGGLGVTLDRDDGLQMDAFGDYVVSEIAGGELEPGTYEITIAMVPVKRCEA